MEAIVHIGQPKAGSTSIQKTLLAATDALEAQRAFYLGLMGERVEGEKRPWQQPTGWPDLFALGTKRAGKEFAEVLGAAAKSLGEAGYERLIWSNETFLANDEVVFPSLEKLTAMGVKLKVVVYVRRPDTWAQSAYLQWGIKHKEYEGPLLSFADWIGKRHTRMASDLKPWLKLEDAEILIRNFDACPDVARDFLECCGLEAADVETERGNETPNAVALALWALYNGQFDEPVLPAEFEHHLRRSGLLDHPPRGVELDSLIWSEDDIARVWNETKLARDELNELLREAGQPELAPDRRACEVTVSQAQINAALLVLLKQQADQIQALRRQVRRLRRQTTG